jgi:hypothetical protein
LQLGYTVLKGECKNILFRLSLHGINIGLAAGVVKWLSLSGIKNCFARDSDPSAFNLQSLAL